MHRRDACSFRPDENKRGKSTRKLKKRSVIFFEKTVSQRPESVWEEISKTVQRLHQWEVHWHPPVCQIYQTGSACKFGEKCLCTERLTVCQRNDRKRTVVKVLFPHEEFQSIRLRIPGHLSRRTPIRFYGGPKTTVQFKKKAHPPCEHSGKKGSIARCDSSHPFS